MSWTLLRSSQEWWDYTAQTSAKFGVGSGVQWGSPPPAYPCLVASTLAGERMLSCFVLPDHARELLDAVEGGGAAGQTVVGGSAAPRGSGPGDTEFRRYIVAHLFALIGELRDVGITNAERYESKFNAFLAGVDQATVSQATNVSPAAIFDREADGGHGD